jgi:RNA-directed DNA polymerase
MRERAKQALVKMALEPAWEAVFEPNSYGFRPGRSAHDAIGMIFNGIHSKPKFVFDADIKGCFDTIDHDKLLKKLNTYPKLIRLIGEWLKAGVLEGQDFTPTEQGTPQGGVISPLLANVALHGMEEVVKGSSAKSGSTEQPVMVRYADDFVVLHSDRAELQRVAERVTAWLAEVGLQLSPKKTRFTHTLDLCEGNVGFDFLGFTVRQFRVGKTHSGKDTHQRPLGFKTLIRPSKEAMKRHTQEIGRKLRELRGAPQGKVISELNPIIRGWCHYHRWVVCTQAFNTCDYTTFRQLVRWGKARHKGKSNEWVSKKYFQRRDGRSVFGTHIQDEEGTPTLIYVKNHTETVGEDWVKVRGTASPYDGNLLYWAKRLKQHPLVKNEKAKLLHRQQWRCPHCGLYFKEGDVLETDHDIPTILGGRDNLSNKFVYHRHCHDEKTASDMAVIARHRAAGVNHKWPYTEEPNAVKVACSVLDWRRGRRLPRRP